MTVKKPLILFTAAIISSAPLLCSAETLQGAIKHALISNPDLLFNRAKTLSTEQSMYQAKGAYYPTVDVAFGYGREKTQSPVTRSIDGVIGSRILTRREASIEFIQNLFSGWGVVGEVERRMHLWHAEEFKTLGMADDLSLEVTELYMNVIRQQELLMLARQNVEVHEDIFSTIEQRSTAGVGRKAELDQASGRLSLARANLLSLQNDLRDARIKFERVVGMAPKNLLWPRTPSSRQLPKTLPNAIQMGLDNHPTLKSAYADIEEAKAQHKVAKSADFPKIDLVLSASRNRNLDGLVGPNDDNLAMLRLRYNIFRGGSDLAHKRETAYQVQEAYEVKNKTVNQLEASVKLSWYAWLTTGQRMEYLRAHVDSSVSTQDAYKEQFKVGKRTLLDLLDTQNETYQAKIDKVKGHFDEVFSRFRILNSMGMLFPFVNGRLAIALHNDDIYTSHENINHGRVESVDGYPKVDMTNNSLWPKPIHNKPHPKVRRHHLGQTTQATQQKVAPYWYVNVKRFNTLDEAKPFAAKLKRMGMKAITVETKNGVWVRLGSYEYRSSAGKAMKQLHDRAKIHAYLVQRIKH